MRLILTAVLAVYAALAPPTPPAGPSSDVLAYLPAVQSANHPVFYVSPSGDDANPGTAAAPWRTLQKASDAAPAGAIVYARSGTYASFAVTRHDLTFAGYPGETVTVPGDSSHLYTVKILDTSDVTLRNLIIQRNPRQYGTAVYVARASHVTIEGSVLRDNAGFGVVLENVTDTLVLNNAITGNGSGVEVRLGSDGVVIRDNRIYDNDRAVDAGRGASGVTFFKTTGPILADNNLLWGNTMADPAQPDGSAFEIYAAGNITMTRNVIWDNAVVLETGTDSRTTPCDRLTFTRNIAYRTTRQEGLILRCASNSLVAHNTFDGLDRFAYDLSHNAGTYGGSIAGLRILNNIVFNGRAYSIDTALPSSVVIDYNLFYTAGSTAYEGQYLAYVVGQGNTSNLAVFRSWTGYDLHGLSANPAFVNPAARDYHLTTQSPAIDRGLNLGEPFAGTAPEIGRYEVP